MIVYMQLNALFPGDLIKSPDPPFHLDVNEYQARNCIHIDIPHPREGKRDESRFDEEFSQVLFLGSGEDHLRFRIEPLSSHHGSEGIEISVKMCRYNIHFSPWGENACELP